MSVVVEGSGAGGVGFGQGVEALEVADLVDGEPGLAGQCRGVGLDPAGEVGAEELGRVEPGALALGGEVVERGLEPVEVGAEPGGEPPAHLTLDGACT